jgi:tRNA nucleotidyltransferase (CCA-adding enzyme)
MHSWEHFYHQADIGVRGVGSDIEGAFEQAAIGLMAVVCSVEKVSPIKRIEIECSCADVELLFVDWLNAIIYEMAVRKMLFGRFEVRISEGRLTGVAFGETANPEKHETAVEVKGATYTELAVREEDGRWMAQCVVDV